MVILGINYFFHDTSACLIKDGDLVIALEEERFTRRKHTWQFPTLALQKVFELSGISPADVDHVAVSIDPLKNAGRKLLYALSLGRGLKPFLRHEVLNGWRKEWEFAAWYKSTFPGPKRPQLHRVGHHLAHIAGTFLVSPYERAALLSMDGSGEWSTTWLGETDGESFTCFSESFFPHSLGSFYEAATEFCGFQPNYDEGKTMGLAPFGDPRRYYQDMSSTVAVDADGRVKLDLSWFAHQDAGWRHCSAKYLRTFGPKRSRSEPLLKHHEDVAAAAQKVLEDKVLEMCRVLEARTSAEYLVVGGGVSLNSVMNGRILRETRFKDLYVMPGAGDNGTCIGAAYYAYNHVLKQPRRVVHDTPFVGSEYSAEQLEKTLKECKVPYERSADVCRDAARMLHEGQILGWFQGRMEIGPRALGSRSILASPCWPNMKDKINAEVKHREAYRPFAPSCLVERKEEFFEQRVEDPFMLKVCFVRPEKRSVIPAVTHVDGSARLQTVRREVNPRYYGLIEEFAKLSGVPVVLNTSFNIMGEPIVESPLQAIRCFFSTGLDTLVLGDFIVRKSR